MVFKSYVGTLENPSVIMQQGETNYTIDVSATLPTGTTGYLNAWIDWNGDGDWDSGEQIANTSHVGSGTISLNFNVPDAATLGTTYARFRFSTQPGLQPTGTAIDGEVEDYQIQIVAKSVKSIVATSEISTTGTNLAIGEIVRYRLAVEIPKGVLTSFTITDNLPAGLKFLNDATAKLALIGTIPITPSDAALESAQITGNAVTTPTFVIPTAYITPTTFGDGMNPVFKLGALTNTNDISTTQYVVVEFNALVLNVVGNQSGGTRNNTFGVSYNNVARTSDSVRVTLVEPDLRIVKSLVPSTPTTIRPGATVTYEISITHSPTSTADAFNVVLTDVIPAELLDSHVVSVTAIGIPAPIAEINGGVLRVPASDSFDMPRYVTVTVRFTATLAANLLPSQQITNTGAIVWSSLPVTGTQNNPTGSNTPGGSGAEDGERNGDGGPVNDYQRRDPEVIATATDFGDLPDGYKTLLASGGASHLILNTGNPLPRRPCRCGSNRSCRALRSPATMRQYHHQWRRRLPGDDEDGITFLTPIYPGRPATITDASCGHRGLLNAWIDFDADGVLDTIPLEVGGL